MNIEDNIIINIYLFILPLTGTVGITMTSAPIVFKLSIFSFDVLSGTTNKHFNSNCFDIRAILIPVFPAVASTINPF